MDFDREDVVSGKEVRNDTSGNSEDIRTGGVPGAGLGKRGISNARVGDRGQASLER